jgi:hypothetical protein
MVTWELCLATILTAGPLFPAWSKEWTGSCTHLRIGQSPGRGEQGSGLRAAAGRGHRGPNLSLRWGWAVAE